MPGFGANTLELFTFLANDHAFVPVTFDHNGGGDFAQVALLLVLVNDHRRGVGQLIPGQTKELFPNHLSSHKSVTAVCQFIRCMHPWLLRKVFFTNAK